MMQLEDFYADINYLIEEFDEANNYEYQAGFNGRSGGYLVLYRGGRKQTHKSICTACGQRNFQSTEENGKKCGRCGQDSRVDQALYQTYTQPGLNISDEEVPGDVLRRFRKLALDIVRDAEYKAKNCKIEEESYTVEKTRKILIEN